jgi:glyoxylase-like metal-dependent hydrolase (beta-lactamase superfamily II)
MVSDRGTVTEVAPGLWQLALPIRRHFLGGANAYLIRDRDGYALVDCGFDVPECADALVTLLGEVGVTLDALHTIVVTHGHPDHWGLAEQIRERSQARVLLHQREADFIGYPYVGGEADRQQMATWLRRYGFPDEEVAAMAGETPPDGRDAHAVPLDADDVLSGGETLAIGQYRFEVLWTPGHTPGSICLLDPSQGVLLSGDHILGVVTPNVGLHPLLERNPMPGYLDSLEDLASREIAVTLPGHGPAIPDLPRVAADLTRRQLRRRDQILSLMTDVPQSAYELASQIWAEQGRRKWADMHRHLRRNAVGTLAAHLDVLAERGEVVCSDDGVVRFRRCC